MKSKAEMISESRKVLADFTREKLDLLREEGGEITKEDVDKLVDWLEEEAIGETDFLHGMRALQEEGCFDGVNSC